jgi:tellurite methyltransferase
MGKEKLSEIEQKYWNNFYKAATNLINPSTFAVFCGKYIDKGSKILEIGCGNARDSAYFESIGAEVTAIDNCKTVIENNIKKYNSKIQFELCDVSNLNEVNIFPDILYARFFLHSLTDQEEDYVINWTETNLKRGSIFCIEARSTLDAKREKAYGNHFRRYIEPKLLISKLENKGFDIFYELESSGLSVYKDEDPYLIRILARKK